MTKDEPKFIQLVVCKFNGESVMYGLTAEGAVYHRKRSQHRINHFYWHVLSMRALSNTADTSAKPDSEPASKPSSATYRRERMKSRSSEHLALLAKNHYTNAIFADDEVPF